MEFMVAWFPAVKLAVLGAFIGAVIFAVKKKWHKTALALMVVGFLFWWLAPVKYDGAETAKHHKQTHKQRTTEYKYVSDEAKVVTTKKKSLAEVLAEEEDRSKKANQEIQNEINK